MVMKEHKVKSVACYIENVLTSGIPFRILSSSVPFSETVNYEKYKKYTLVRSIKSEEILDIVRTTWTHFPEDALSRVVQVLEENKVLRRSNSNEYKILLDRLIPKDVIGLYTGYSKRRENSKSGTCPRCGQQVKYKNRHARSGTQHTGEDCSLNLVKSVMEP